VGVEKLILRELTENSSRQEALQAIVSTRVDIVASPDLGRFALKRVFQQPRLLASTDDLSEAERRTLADIPPSGWHYRTWSEEDFSGTFADCFDSRSKVIGTFHEALSVLIMGAISVPHDRGRS
jgi:hypothetical protein